MKKNIIKTNMTATVGPYSQAIKADNNITTQTDQIFKNIKAIINAASTTLTDVVRCSCFTKNVNNLDALNVVYAKYFETILPARECAESCNLPKNALIAIHAICHE